MRRPIGSLLFIIAIVGGMCSCAPLTQGSRVQYRRTEIFPAYYPSQAGPNDSPYNGLLFGQSNSYTYGGTMTTNFCGDPSNPPGGFCNQCVTATAPIR